MTLEKNLQSRIIKYLRELEFCWVIKYNGNYRGAPDLIILYKGNFIGVELKRPKKHKISEWQLKQKEKIEKCGGHHYFVTSLKEIKSIIKIYEKEKEN